MGELLCFLDLHEEEEYQYVEDSDNGRMREVSTGCSECTDIDIIRGT